MRVLTAVLRGGVVLGCLAATAGPSLATDMPVYASVQTESEMAFVAGTLDLKDRLADLQRRVAGPVRLAYASLDLDADGQAEIFIRVYLGADCAVDSCSTLIFNKANDHWVKVLETTEPEVTVAKQVHRGYRDILVGSQPWLWTGKAYAPVR